MIRENCQSTNSKSLRTSRPWPLVSLLVATSMAATLACSSDDDPETATQSLEGFTPVAVTERPEPGPYAGGPTPNGLSIPSGIEDWRVLGAINLPATPDAPNATVRVIVGNGTAVDAARAGQINPWPDGSMIAHYQWAAGSTPESGLAVTPGDFARLTMMVRNSALYAADGNWAYGVWQTANLMPPAEPAPGAQRFDRACVNCHMSSGIEDKDFVFSVPGALPTSDAIAAAPTLSNGLTLPAGIADWRVIGVASRATDAMNPSIRVIVGNDIAVDAARAGETNPWPDGSMLAHYVWAASKNADITINEDAVTPGAFGAFTLMVKDAAQYADDGGWAYGAWSGANLTAPAAADFDRACVNCHVGSVSENDYVFTRPGALPARFTAE